VVDSSVAGSFTAQIDVDIDGDGPLATKTEIAKVTYIDASIKVEGDGTNGIGEPHPFTVLVTVDEGQGSIPVDQVNPAVSFDNAPSNVDDGCADPGTIADGTCTVEIISNDPGVFNVDASVTFTYRGLNFTRDTAGILGPTGPAGNSGAQKTYIAGSLKWLKVDGSGSLLGGATFVACPLDGSGNPLTADCLTVSDNSADDADPDNGEFWLTGLKLGNWSVQETAPPEGYFGDSEKRTAPLTITDEDFIFTDPWINQAFPGRILETGTTCQDYVDGEPTDLTEVIYRIDKKNDVINNVAPGVFFYYTTFTAPSKSFTVDVFQENNGPDGFPNFLVQNTSNIRLFNGNCSLPTATMTLDSWDDQAKVTISDANPNDVFVLSVKYETGAVVGSEPGTVHYDYSTFVDEKMVDRDLDGVNLKKKGTK
jgi:hypothetical protein